MALWLYLMRHAQSAERQSSQADEDRELTSAGMKDAASIGHFLKKNNYNPELLVSSAARRAESTAIIIHGIINIQNEILIHDELYEASVRNLLEITNSLEDEFKKVLLIGHNPYISYFAEYLSKAEIGSIEPAGLVSIRFDINKWAEVTEGSGSMENYLRPSQFD